MKSPPALILASSSVYRRQLLARLQIPFECEAPGIDEAAHPGERALALVARLALAKAHAVAVRHRDAWVIGSDQVAVEADSPDPQTIVGKPGTVANCIDQLINSSGRTLSFLTAVAVMRQRDSSLTEFIDITRVALRPLDRAAIERYVERESPLDCAGGFKSEGLGIALCQAIDGSDPTALIGLPLIRLGAILRHAGFDVP